MTGLLDFENEKYQKGYKPLYASRDNFKANIGKKICYVDFVEPNRGTYFVRYGVVHSVKYSRLYLDDGDRSVDSRCGDPHVRRNVDTIYPSDSAVSAYWKAKSDSLNETKRNK